MAETKGDWSSHDNKRYRGRIDRVFVSMTERYETAYYIDHYLETHKFTITNANRDVIAQTLETYPGRAPFKRTDLDVFLDGRITRKS